MTHVFKEKIDFVLLLENKVQRTSYKWYYLPTVKIKNYKVIIDGQIFFDLPEKNDLITYNNIGKVAAGQVDDYTTEWLLGLALFQELFWIRSTHLN